MHKWELILENFGNTFWEDVNDPYSQTYKIQINGEEYRDFTRFSWFYDAMIEMLNTNYVLDRCHDSKNNIQKDIFEVYIMI